MAGSFASLPSNNLVLACLASADRQLLAVDLQPVAIRLGSRIERRGRAATHVHFPSEGIVSMIVQGADGRRIEVGMIGREGMTGTSVVMGVDRSAHEGLVQVAVRAHRITASKLRAAMAKSAALRSVLLRSTHVLGVQTAQTALSNALGTLEERLARWLLMTHDRIAGDELPFTHEFLSIMLGVRRAGVSVALDLLQRDGLIYRRRGVIRIVDRTGLEIVAGDVYGVPEAELSRVMRAP